MRVVIQRVNHAQVDIAGKTVGKIGKGFLLLVGIKEGMNFPLSKKQLIRLPRCVFLKMKMVKLICL